MSRSTTRHTYPQPTVRTSRRTTRRLAGDVGATAVEFALLAPLLFVFVGGILVFALHMTYAALAEHTASVGLEKASIRASGSYPSDSAVRTTIAGLKTTQLLGNPVSPPVIDRGMSQSQGSLVTITVEYAVPGLDAAADLIPEVGPFADLSAKLKELGTVRRVAKGRSE